MTSLCYNAILKRVAFAGDDGIHIVDIQDFKESKGDFIPIEDLESGKVSGVYWSPDGQILSVCTTAGNVYNFLAKMSILNAKYKTSIAYLSSLREISVVDAVKKGRPTDVSLKLEPSIIAVGAKHVAAGMNNRVYYHRLDEDATQANDQEYHLGTIREVQLNHHYAVVLTDKKAMLHPIEPSPDAHENSKTFPIKDEGLYAIINSIALTDDFLYYGTEAGSVELFFLSEWKELPSAELRLENPIRKLYPNTNGTRVVIVTSLDEVFLYNPVIGGGSSSSSPSALKFDNTPMKIVTVLWDTKEKNVIMLYDGKYTHSCHYYYHYYYYNINIKGNTCMLMYMFNIV